MCRSLLLFVFAASANLYVVDGASAQVGEIDEKLDRRIDADFVETPLKDAIQSLQKLTDIQFYLRAKRLEEASVSPDTPVTISLKNLPARTVLELMLGELELSYLAKDGLVLITTPEDAENQLEMRVYDCRDLLKMAGLSVSAITSQNEAVTSGPRETTHQPAAEATGLTVSPKTNQIVGCGSVIPPRLKAATKQEQLLELVTVNVAADTWDRLGGPGAISEFNGLVVVTQTADVQRKVRELLEMMREAAGLEAPKTGKVAR
jgi:hypothetical protein